MATTDVQMRPRPQSRARNSDRRHTLVVGLKTSKFRHVSVKSGGKEGVFINLRQVNTRLRPESNGFCISDRWAAVPLSVSGGVVAIFDMAKPIKVADGVIPGLENGSGVADLVWCPFDENVLAVGCDNGMVNFWTIPDEGIDSVQTNPTKTLKAHSDRINVLKFNPVAADVLASAANNGEVIIWDTGALEQKIRLQTPSCPVLSMTWSSDGRQLAVIFRDCYLRVYEPRVSNIPILESHVLETPRGARVLYVCNDRFLLMSSLSKSSQRTIGLYNVNNLSLVHTFSIDSSSSLLIPHYDFDSSVVFLTGKGDRTIHMYEICEDAPYFLQLSPFVAPTSHQAIAFSSKNVVDVSKVEVARGARLLLSELENMTLVVPRVKMELFQNDLFPPTLVTWEPITTAGEWFRGAEVRRKFKVLKPSNMEPLYSDLYLLDMARYFASDNASVTGAEIGGHHLNRPHEVNGKMEEKTKRGVNAKMEEKTTGEGTAKMEEKPNGENGKTEEKMKEEENGKTEEKRKSEVNGSAEEKQQDGISGKTEEKHSNEMNGKAEEKEDSEMNGKTTTDGDFTDRGQGDGVPTPRVASMMKAIEDGLSSVPSPVTGSGKESSPNGKPSPQQPKRLSIDPNCGHPFRDLLRRCDEMPGVEALTQEKPGIDDGGDRAANEWE